MSVLIFGCGYLGRRLAQQCVSSGCPVYATTRSLRTAGELAGAGIEPIVCDVLDPLSLAGLPVVDRVVWAVGLDRSTGVSMRRVFVEGLDNVLAALPGNPRLIYVSSTGVYGQTDGGEVDESAETHPAEESGKVVLEAEQLLRSRRADAVVLRFAGIYGPQRLIRSKDLLANRLLAIDPEKWLNLIHVEDGVRAVRAACLLSRPGQVYNVCDDRPARRREFYTRLAELLDAPAPRFVPPPPPVPVGERVNRRIVNRRLRQELGVSLAFPSFEEGLAASSAPAGAP